MSLRFLVPSTGRGMETRTAAALLRILRPVTRSWPAKRRSFENLPHALVVGQYVTRGDAAVEDEKFFEASLEIGIAQRFPPMLGPTRRPPAVMWRNLGLKWKSSRFEGSNDSREDLIRTIGGPNNFVVGLSRLLAIPLMRLPFDDQFLDRLVGERAFMMFRTCYILDIMDLQSGLLVDV